MSTAPALLKIVISLVLLVGVVSATAYLGDFESLSSSFADLSWSVILLVLVLFLTGALMGSLRLWIVARDVSHPISFQDAVAALSIGYIAGGIFFQIVGQTVARGVLLARRGIPVAAVLVMSGYERAVILAVSVVLAVAGAWFLFGRLALDMASGGAELIELVIVAIFAVFLGATLAWGREALSALASINKISVAWCTARSIAISLIIQLCTMAAYIVSAQSLEPTLPTIELAAAAAIVMLAASLPISLAGWGVRELSAVLALSAIGMPADKALAVAVLIGVASILALALLAAVSVLLSVRTRPIVPATSGGGEQKINFSVALTWVLPVAAATAVFFQAHVPTGSGNVLNVNFADPLAIVAGTLFVIWAIRDRRWPDWRVTRLNAYIVAATSVLILGFVVGWMSFGWTTWAFTNKLVGWFVLLAYGATGALIVYRGGEVGYRILLGTFVAAGVAVITADLVLVLLQQFGVGISETLVGPRIVGFAQNPNAFAFQIVLVFVSAMIFAPNRRLAFILCTICATGIWFSGSRAGLGAWAIALLVMAWRAPHLRLTLLLSLGCAAAVVLSVLTVPLALAAGFATYQKLLSGVPQTLPLVPQRLPLPPVYNPLVADNTASNFERMATIKAGIELFLAHPIIGAGLGAFAEQWRRAWGTVQVIHSTPVWLLAEFGLVGAAIIIAPFARILRHEFKAIRRRDNVALLLLCICIAFAVMSSVHEMLYQRAFWLLLGASLAVLPNSVSGRPGRYV